MAETLITEWKEFGKSLAKNFSAINHISKVVVKGRAVSGVTFKKLKHSAQFGDQTVAQQGSASSLHAHFTAGGKGTAQNRVEC